MTDRPTGYYLLSGPDEPEVGRWDADTRTWALVGAIDAVEDADVTVLREEPLVLNRGEG